MEMTTPPQSVLEPVEGVRDPDLLEIVEKARGSVAYKATLAFVRASQAKRDAESEARDKLVVLKAEAAAERARLPRNARRR
ncbi:hypothetical protein QR79_29790, partial [Methylobacterium indicum]